MITHGWEGLRFGILTDVSLKASNTFNHDQNTTQSSPLRMNNQVFNLKCSSIDQWRQDRPRFARQNLHVFSPPPCRLCTSNLCLFYSNLIRSTARLINRAYSCFLCMSILCEFSTGSSSETQHSFSNSNALFFCNSKSRVAKVIQAWRYEDHEQCMEIFQSRWFGVQLYIHQCTRNSNWGKLNANITANTPCL